MKRFSSYGPPNPRTEFMVQRPGLVQQIAGQLIGNPEDKGHYFTIFAPRQRGKTTTLRSVVQYIQTEYPGQFHVGMDILQIVQDLRLSLPWVLKGALGIEAPAFQSWDEVQRFFSKEGPLKKPVILILDEFDALPQSTLEDTIAFFRHCYHRRNENRLHGVALIGVHSSLGKLEGRTSPFNVQRSVNVPNLTREEVFDLYGQYTAESGQPIEPEGIERIYEIFRGQPGLTCWFGELLTEKYNQVQPPPWERKEGPPPEGYPLITRTQIERVINLGQYSEININIRNLISKGLEHKTLLRELFVSHSVRFDLNEPALQWLYLNGILVGEPGPTDTGEAVCAFASPFVQRCLFSAFGHALNDAYRETLLVSQEDAFGLREVLLGLDVPSLLTLYRRFLVRQVAKGASPWSEQPARSDARAFEAIGHFNLYAWLYGVAKGAFSVVPEFPTGNGTADLLLVNRTKGREEVLEVKSFTSTSDLAHAVTQAARYAKKLKLRRAYLVVMADTSAHAYLSRQPATYAEEGLEILLEIIPWGFVPGDTDASRQQTTDILPKPDDTRTTRDPKKPTQRRTRKSVAQGQPSLNIGDRLELADRVIAQLTLPQARRLWTLLDQPSAELPGTDPGMCWDELVSRCVKTGKLPDLLTALLHTCPALREDPLLIRLSASFPE